MPRRRVSPPGEVSLSLLSPLLSRLQAQVLTQIMKHRDAIDYFNLPVDPVALGIPVSWKTNILTPPHSQFSKREETRKPVNK